MTDTSALIEGHYLVTSYPAAWCQCGRHLRWGSREQDHAAHVVTAIQAQALRDAADEWEALVQREVPPVRGSVWLKSRATRLTATTNEEPTT